MPKFCFEFEFYNKQDPNYLLIQRFPVHYEDSEDILDDAKCVKVSLNDVLRFLDEEKVKFNHSQPYKVILEISFPFLEPLLSRQDYYEEMQNRSMGSIGGKNDSTSERRRGFFKKG